MSDLTLGQRLLIRLRLLYPPCTDPVVWQERRRRQDATSGLFMIAFGGIGVLGVLIAVTGAVMQDWILVVIGVVEGVLGALACRKFVRFRRRRRLEQPLNT